MKKLLGVLLFLSCSFASFSQHKYAYQLFDSKGRKTNYQQLLKKSKKTNIILFGEYHDNPISHWLQLMLTQDLHKTKPITLGAEMIERDNQKELDKYLRSEIDQQTFDTTARLWNNYHTDYKPLIDFAKENKLTFVATNIPRRYASRVYKKGLEVLDTLPDEEKKWIAPLPIKYDGSLSQYQKMVEMMQGHGGDNFPKSQAIKDATMAHSIIENSQENSIFIHYNGSFHSDFHQGIYWYIKQERPNINIITIATVSQNEVSKLEKEHLGRADFIIVVHQDMTKTF